MQGIEIEKAAWPAKPKPKPSLYKSLEIWIWSLEPRSPVAHRLQSDTAHKRSHTPHPQPAESTAHFTSIKTMAPLAL
jgi:hypothetical protein